MAHLRTDIVHAVEQTLKALPLNVYRSRVYDVAAAQLPAIFVAAAAEAITADGISSPRILERRLSVSVRIFAAVTADLDDVLDDLCRQVEPLLAMPCAALDGIANDIVLTDTRFTFSGDGDVPAGEAEMTYEVLYITAENAPDVLI